jgi:serine/threonine protein kinase
LDETQPIVAVLSDFGISRVADITDTPMIGTCLFVPPEVINGEKHSKSSDIYALGIIMWMVITKKTELKDMYPTVGGTEKQILDAVVKGIRPPITDDILPLHANLMKR